MDRKTEVAGVTFSDSDSAPVPKFLNPGPAFFKFENPTPVKTLATIINAILIYPCFYLRNGHTDSCYCRNWKVTPDPVFSNYWIRDRIRVRKKYAESCRSRLRIRSHLCGKTISEELETLLNKKITLQRQTHSQNKKQITNTAHKTENQPFLPHF